MKVLHFGYINISTYILVIGLAFLISFIVFRKISKINYSKIDIMYIYAINIIGFGIGSKLMSLILNNIEITIHNFINSGYSFLGGILVSILVVAFYCKRYKLDFISMLPNFAVIYPLIYSISKIGCFLNGCCNGIISINDINHKFPLQLVDSIVMFILFLILLITNKKRKTLVLPSFFSIFYTYRFLEDYFRESRSIVVFNFTLEQVLCVIIIIASIVINVLRMHKSKT